MRSTSTRRGSSRAASRRSTTTSEPSWRSSARTVAVRAGAAGRPSSTSATAAHRAVRELLERLGDGGHWCCSSTISTGRTRRRSSCSAACSAGRRPPPCSWLSPSAPAKRRSAVGARSSERHRAGTLQRLEVGALTPGEARELLGEAVDDDAMIALYEDAGGNPFYLEQLARSLALELQRGRSPALARRSRRAAGGCGRAGRGARAPLGLRTEPAGGGCCRGGPVPARASRRGGGHFRGVGARGPGRAAEARPRPRDRGAAPLSLPASAHPAGGLPVDARRLATRRPRSERRGAHGPRCLGRRARPPCRAFRAAGRRGRRGNPPFGRRGRLPACARECRALAWMRAAAPARMARHPLPGSSSCYPEPGRWWPAVSSPTATPPCSRASRLHQPRPWHCG